MDVGEDAMNIRHKRIALTKRWANKQHPNHSTSCALWKDVYLTCVKSVWAADEWTGIVYFGSFRRKGGLRRSREAAQRDAERLAVELLMDIRDGAAAVMEEYGIGEE